MYTDFWMENIILWLNSSFLRSALWKNSVSDNVIQKKKKKKKKKLALHACYKLNISIESKYQLKINWKSLKLKQKKDE